MPTKISALEERGDDREGRVVLARRRPGRGRHDARPRRASRSAPPGSPPPRTRRGQRGAAPSGSSGRSGGGGAAAIERGVLHGPQSREGRLLRASEIVAARTPGRWRLAARAARARARMPAARAPSTSLSSESPTCSASRGLGARQLERRANDAPPGLRRAHLGGGHHAVHQSTAPRRREPVRQRAVPVARDHQPSPAPRSSRSAPGTSGKARNSSAPSIARAPSRGRARAGRAPRASPRRSGRAGRRALRGPPPRGGARGSRRSPPRSRGPPAPRPPRSRDSASSRAQARRRRLELDQRAERVEQHRADRRHAIQCQLANCAVNRPEPDRRTRAPPAR